jgi:hypothetical protein
MHVRTKNNNLGTMIFEVPSVIGIIIKAGSGPGPGA